MYSLEDVVQQQHQSTRVQCPVCSEDRKKKSEKTLSVTVTPTGSLYMCHHCGIKGSIRKEAFYEKHLNEKPKQNVTQIPTQLNANVDIIRQFFKGRGVHIEGLDSLPPMTSGTKWFKGVGEVPAIGFVYGTLEDPQAIKWRSVEGKHFSCDGAPKSFYGTPSEGEDLYVVEGEMDVIALASIGISAVSCPNGAPSQVSSNRIDPSEDGKFSYIWEERETIEKAPRIILATDNDGPGEALAEEIARRVGRAKCWRVRWPDKIKDANDSVRDLGAEKTKKIISSAEPMPLAGVYGANEYIDQIKDIYKNGTGKGASTGLDVVDDLFTVAPGQLTIVTGLPGSGKSEFVDQLMVNLSQNEEWKFAVCSFENPPHMHIAKLAEKIVGKPFFEGFTPRMSEKELADAVDFINDHFVFLESKDGNVSTIESIIERTRQAVMRLGVRGVLIDPYNFIDVPGESENKAISDMLTKITVFAKAHDLHIWFVAHPQKVHMREDGTYPVPTGMTISGCYSADTEVLTSCGWIPHPEVNSTHVVACFNPETEELEWHNPQQVHRYDHDGVMHHWVGQAMDMLVTPNHRMVVKPAYKNRPKSGSPITGRPPSCIHDKWQFVRSEDVPGTRWSIPTAAQPADNQKPVGPLEGYDPVNLAWFIGFWVAGGCTQSGSLSVCQEVDKHHHPKRVMDALSLRYSERIETGMSGERSIWTAYLLRRDHPNQREITEFIEAECGEGCDKKRVPEYLYSASIEEKQAFLDGFFFGDGSQQGNVVRLHTTSPDLADGLQRLAIECGFSSHITTYDREPPERRYYSVTVKPHTERAVEVRRNRRDVDYTGFVYCLTVPTGAYITRRNGKMAVCGNSAAWFAKADLGITLHRDDDGVLLKCWKSRWKWVGRVGDVRLSYDITNGRYRNYERPFCSRGSSAPDMSWAED